MKKLVIFICFIILLCQIDLVEGIKKKKKQVDDKRPVTMEKEMFCNACQAITREMLKKIKQSRKETDIIDSLSDICNQKNFNIYDYPPPDMKKGCEAFMSSWAEVLEVSLVRRTNNEEVEDEICLKKTKACVGIAPDAKPKKQEFITVNNKKMPVGPDGQVKFGTEEDL